MGVFAYRVEIDPSVESMILKNDPARLEMDKFKDQFGNDELIIIAFNTKDVFRKKVLLFIKDLTEELESVSYVKEVTSLYNRPLLDLVYEAATVIRETAHPDVNLIFGAVLDENMNGKIRITVVATGFERNETRMPIIEYHDVKRDAPNGQEREVEYAGVSGGQSAWARPRFSPNDLEIPAFLRRR